MTERETIVLNKIAICMLQSPGNGVSMTTGDNDNDNHKGEEEERRSDRCVWMTFLFKTSARETKRVETMRAGGKIETERKRRGKTKRGSSRKGEREKDRE